jgi:hypothetical protein
VCVCVCLCVCVCVCVFVCICRHTVVSPVMSSVKTCDMLTGSAASIHQDPSVDPCSLLEVSMYRELLKIEVEAYLQIASDMCIQANVLCGVV